MPKYKETTIASVYTRANSILITNELNQTPKIRFNEEKVVVDNGLESPQGFSGSACFEELRQDNLNEEFNIINIETGDIIGTSTYSQLQQYLYSLYFHVASKRDQMDNLNTEFTRP